MKHASGALHGIRIVECAHDIAAPYTAMLLAEQGAEVIKVEPPAGDRARVQPGFHVWNRSKRGVVADLASDAGRAQVATLCSTADVLVSDGFPAHPALRYDVLAAANPRLIHCWMPPYGGCGEAAGAPPNDDLVAARSGLLAGQWANRDGPVFLTLPIASYGTAILAAGAVCAALLARARSGRGQPLEVSWLAGAFAMQTGGIIDHPALQRVMTMVRDPLGPIPVYRLFKASDDWLFIACGNSTFWNKLCLVLERPEMVSDPRFDGAPWAVPPPHWAELKSLVQSIVATRPREEWLRLLSEADIPSAPVLARREFIDDPQVRHLGMRQEIDDPTLGRTLQMGVPVHLRDNPGAIQGPAPQLNAATSDTWQETSAPSPRPSPGMGEGKSGGFPHGPLSGTLVLDFTSYIAGPAATATLALAGADVIKIEPQHGDPFRVFGFGFYGWNQGKRGLALDFSQPAARAIIYDLVRKADVLVENLRPGATRRLGVDYETVAPLNPGLIYGSLTAFGAGGPRGHEAGFDPLLQARSGVMAAQGGHGNDPIYLACAVSDYGAGLLCAFGVMAALLAREQTGRGQLVETSLAQSVMAMQSGELLFHDGRPDMEHGGPDLLGRHPLRRAYRCTDGWLFVSMSGTFPRRLLDVPIDDPASEPADGPTGIRLAEAFACRSRSDALAALAAAGVAAAPVLTVAELFQDPHIAANDLLYTTTVEPWGELHQTGTLVKYAATPVTVRYAAPRLGEHSEEILRDTLGYAPERIAALRSAGVIVGTT